MKASTATISKTTTQRGLLFSAAFLFVALNAHGQTTDWPIGKEREVDEGVYMSVTAVQDGWRIWKVEQKNDTSCIAVKSAKGRPHPVPVGVSSMFTGGTPYLEITQYSPGGELDYTWRTKNFGDVRLKIRPVGARFYDEMRNIDFDESKSRDGQYDVVLSSWEYPAVSVGYSEESAVFDMAGRTWAEEQVRKCKPVANPNSDQAPTVGP